jgi:hypothetical protein
MLFSMEFSGGSLVLNEEITRQHIICFFDKGASHAVYTLDQVLNHDTLYMEEMRAPNTDPEYQAACIEYARQRAENPSVALMVLELLAQDLEEHGGHPEAAKNGFDLGVCVIQTEDCDTLLKGGTLVFGIFPRKRKDRIDPAAAGWPFEGAPITISLPVGDEDPGIFWGLVGAGLSADPSSFVVQLNSTAETNWERRKEAFTKILTERGGVPLLIHDSAKHCFLNHALNRLIEDLNETLAGGGSQLTLSLSNEAEVHVGEEGNVLAFTPRPRLRSIAN